jgi:hypothetical protein
MAEMIISHMKKYAKAEIQKQYDAQFPPGWEKEEMKRSSEDSTALDDLVQVIIKSKQEKECEKALQKFRDYLTPQGMIKTGYHFNHKLLLEAFEFYEKKYHSFSKQEK